MTMFFFMDGRKYDWPKDTIDGATLRALIPGLNPTFAITREATPDDHIVQDDEVIDLAGSPSFYTTPPATFGCSTVAHGV